MSHNPAFANTTAGALDTSAASDATLRQQGLGLGGAQPPPTHHLHRSSDALPGARGYPQNLDQPDGAYSSGTGAGMGAGAGMDSGSDPLAPRRGQQDFAANDFAQRGAGTGVGGRSAFTEERPLGVQPTERGGVAIGGQSDLPMGHAGMVDKLVGKTQKVAGKMTGNPEMHERGELRESGGKAAAEGMARAPHD